MAAASQSVEIAWGPGFIGVLLSLVMFGVSFGQVILYLRSFPNDSKPLKLTIGTMFLFDCAQTAGFIGTFWHWLLTCRSSTSSDCQMTSFNWATLMTFTGSYTISLFTQSFYIHRVWIISGRNNLATGVLVFCAVVQMLLGFLCVEVGLETHDWQVMYSSPYPALASGFGLAFNVLVTISIAHFLRPRPRMSKQENYIHQLKAIFIEMGLLSCIVSALVTVAFSLPSPQARLDWTAAAGPVLSKTSFNSVLAVLNTRKAIRQRYVEARGQMHELRTIHTSTLLL